MSWRATSSQIVNWREVCLMKSIRSASSAAANMSRFFTGSGALKSRANGWAGWSSAMKMKRSGFLVHLSSERSDRSNMSEIIQDGKLVELTYKVTDRKSGHVLTRVEFPLGYVHGHNEILAPSVHKELEGKSVGDVIEVPIDGNQIFGPRD